MAQIAFLCPFDLNRQTGSPIRARLTIDAVSQFASCYTISLGELANPAHQRLDGVWVPRRGGGHRFRVGTFTRLGARALGAISPPIVHCFNTVAMLPALLHRRRRGKAKLVLELHGLLAEESESRWPGMSVLHRLIDRIGIRGADAIIAMSHSQRQILLDRYGVAPESVSVMWGPVDLDLFVHREPAERDVFRVGYAGNDGPWQGIEELMASVATFQGEAGIRFRFIGFQGNRLRLPEAVPVEFIPLATRQETAALLSDCDVLVSPRRGGIAETQYPFKLSAYLAVGRPIVATDVSDQRAILEAAACGVVVQPGSADPIAAAIRRVWGMTRAQRAEMGRRGRRFAEEHLSVAGLRVALAEFYKTLADR